jgi:hypothetical protein
MTLEQELHLRTIKEQFAADVDAKYRAGVREHGGNLWEMPTVELIDEAMKEAVDQYVYLATLRGQLLRLPADPENPLDLSNPAD